MYKGMEVRGVRDLSHLDESTLKHMIETGNAPTIVNGPKLQLHHLQQNSKGPLVEIPGDRHKGYIKSQHPFGNQKGAGLTHQERLEFSKFRKQYWKERAKEELIRRGISI